MRPKNRVETGLGADKTVERGVDARKEYDAERQGHFVSAAPWRVSISGKADRRQAMGGQGQVRKIREVYAELERLNRQALDPAAHQNPTRMNQLNQEMKRLRASVGEQTLGDRVESGLGAIAASSAGSVANAAGLAAETAGEFVRAWEGVGDKEIARNRADMTRKILETGRLTDGRPVTPGMRPQLEEALARYEAEHAAAEPQKSFQERHPVLTKAKTGLYGFADRAGEDAVRLTAEAKEGLGAAGQMAVDVGIAGGQMEGPPRNRRFRGERRSKGAGVDLAVRRGRSLADFVTTRMRLLRPLPVVLPLLLWL